MREKSCESNVLHDLNIGINLDYFANISKTSYNDNLKNFSLRSITVVKANDILIFQKKLYTSNTAINFTMTNTRPNSLEWFC